MAKKGKKYMLRDIRAAIQKKSYGQANLFFSNVRIKRGQEAEAVTLRHTVFCGLALKYFRDRRYQRCIQYIAEQTPSLTQPSDQLQLISGLAHFFLTEFDKAIPLLQAIIEKSSFASFRFYYLLCLVYQGHEKALIGIDELADARQGFLKVAQLLKQKSYKNATDLLEKIEPDSNSEFQNKKCLLEILQNNISSSIDNPKLRPLYRAMTGMVLSESEIEYLSSFPVLTEHYDLGTTRAAKTIDPDEIVESVRSLCNNGIPIPKAIMNIALNAPVEILPTLLFNQVAALFRQDDEDLEEVYLLIRDQYKHLCKVPEFIFLLADLIKVTNAEKIPAPLYYIVKDYVANFKDSWTVEKATLVSIQLSEVFHRISPDGSVDKMANLLGQQYMLNQDLVTLSWDCFALHSTTPTEAIKWSHLSLFTRSIEPVAKAMIRDDFIQMVEQLERTFSDPFASFGYDLDGFEMSMAAQGMKKKLLYMFEQLLVKQPPLKSDNFPMTLLLILRRVIKFNAQGEEQFKKIWADYAGYFNEASDSELQKKYKRLKDEEALAKEDYRDYFKTKKKYTQAIKEGKDLIKLLDVEVAKIIQLIDSTHFDYDALDRFGELIIHAKKGIKYGMNQKEVLLVFQKMIKKYINLCRNYECEHPVEFFYDLIREIIALPPSRIKALDLLIAETCLKAGSQFIFDNEEVYGVHFDSIQKYTDTALKLIKKDASFNIDLTFIERLVSEHNKFQFNKR